MYCTAARKAGSESWTPPLNLKNSEAYCKPYASQIAVFVLPLGLRHKISSIILQSTRKAAQDGNCMSTPFREVHKFFHGNVTVLRGELHQPSEIRVEILLQSTDDTEIDKV